MKRSVWVILIVFLSGLVGCASTATIKNITRQPIEKIEKIETLSVQVEPGPASLKQAKEFQQIIVAELQEKGFKTVEKSDNVLVISIKDIRAVSILARAVGDLAGKSRVEAEVIFQREGKNLFGFSVSSKTGAWTNPLYNPGSITQAFKAAAKEIVNQLKQL